MAYVFKLLRVSGFWCSEFSAEVLAFSFGVIGVQDLGALGFLWF